MERSSPHLVLVALICVTGTNVLADDVKDEL